MTVEIRALREDDDRSAFRSGDEALDLYFHAQAGQNQFRHHIGVTYVAALGHQVLGFVTLSTATLDAEELPSGHRMPPYPVPVLRIARLATDERARGRKVGRALLQFSFLLAERQRDEVGCVGVLVDAKPDAIPFYERFGFVSLSSLSGIAWTLPRPTPMFLPLGSVPRRRD